MTYLIDNGPTVPEKPSLPPADLDRFCARTVEAQDEARRQAELPGLMVKAAVDTMRAVVELRKGLAAIDRRLDALEARLANRQPFTSGD